MTAIKLYRVSITIETVIAASDPRQACSVASRLLRDGDLSEEGPVIAAAPITSPEQLPSGWDVGLVPWGDCVGDVGETLAAMARGETL